MAESTTVFGSTIEIRAEVRSDEPLQIYGKVSGRIVNTAGLMVESGGQVEAEVTTESIGIHGSVVGNVEASQLFELHADGRMDGNTRAPRVILADGCKYKGYIETTSGASG